MTGFLVLEDGTVFRGESVGADGVRVRRGRLHDRDDRLPGGRHRPELRRAARLLHRADGRQLRRRAPTRNESRGVHARAVLMREARGPAWTDWLAERGIPALSGIDTRSLVLHLRERGAMRAAVVAGDGSVEEALRAVRELAADGRAARSPARSRRASRTSTATRAGRGSRSSTTAASARSSRRLAARGRAGGRLPARHARRGAARGGTDGVLLSNGPGDPSRADARGRGRCAGCSAGCRCSASASATSCSRSRPGTRRSSSASATAAPTTRCWSARPAACSSRARTTASRSRRRDGRGGDARLALRRHRRGARATRELRARSVQFHPEAGPGPHDARPLIDELGRGGARLPRRRDLESICLIGSGPDRDRAGLRVRLRRLPGAEGAARGRLPDDRRQLEPGDDHDRPRLRRPHLPRAARLRGRRSTCSRASGRTRCCRRWAARPRSTSRSSWPSRACSPSSAIELIGAPRRRDPPRRGPRALPRDRAARPGCKVPESTRRHRAGTTCPPSSRFPVDPAAGLHARRPRRRHRPLAGPSFEPMLERALPREPGRARCSSRSRCSAGTSSSSR